MTLSVRSTDVHAGTVREPGHNERLLDSNMDAL